MEKDLAILIRRSPLTETSLIVHWCSLGHGIVKTVAKGARNPKNKFHGNLDLFYEAEIEFVHSRTSDLHTLRDIAVLDPRFSIRTSYARTLAAAYFIRLLEIVCERDAPIPELFDLLKRALDYLEKEEPDWKAVIHYESEAAGALGVAAAPARAIEAIRALHHRVPEQREELRSLLNRPPEGDS